MGIRPPYPFRMEGWSPECRFKNEPQGGMSVREAGRRGGERVKAKYGTEFYEEIGRKGGEATKTKYGPSFYEVIGQKGGQKPKRKS